MKWTVGFDVAAAKQLRKLGPVAAQKIRAYLAERLEGAPAPRAYDKPLRGDLAGRWRYRVEAYRAEIPIPLVLPFASPCENWTPCLTNRPPPCSINMPKS